MDDDITAEFYIKLEVFNNTLTVDIKTVIGDFKVKISREEICIPKIGKLTNQRNRILTHGGSQAQSSKCVTGKVIM